MAAGDIGLAFQIRDDILDVTGSLETLGKTAHKDEKEDKTTYVSMTGVDEAEKKVIRAFHGSIGTAERTWRRKFSYQSGRIPYAPQQLDHNLTIMPIL